MSGTLGPARHGGDDRRPYHWGRIVGLDPGGGFRALRIEWLVDSGAEISVVQDNVGRRFKIDATGLTAKPTTGNGKIVGYDGMEVQFGTTGPWGSSTAHVVRPVGVKSDDQGQNLLGMDALAAHRTTLVWDPDRASGVMWDGPDLLVARTWVDDHAEDARALIADVRARLHAPTTTVDADRDGFSRLEEEVDAILKGFVGRREAVAVWLCGIDLWNDVLVGPPRTGRLEPADREAIDAAFVRLVARVEATAAGEVRDQMLARLEVQRGWWSRTD